METVESDFQYRLNLVKYNVEEVITESELESLLRENKTLRCYAGYEPARRVHIGWLTWMLKLRDLQRAGFEVIVLEATWHAWINDKGTPNELEEYTEKVRKVLSRIGVSPKYVRSEDLLSDPEYLKLMLRAAKNLPLERIRRAVVVMRRRASEIEQDFAKMLYPVMQAVDSVYLRVDISVGGLEQKPAFMIGRDIATKLGVKPPVILGLPVIPGLRADIDETAVETIDTIEMYSELKMSSSRPDDAIFLEDSAEDIERKIRSANCPPKLTKFNPVLSMLKHIVLPYFGKIEVQTRRGVISVTSSEILDKLYSEGEITPDEIKRTCLDYVVKIVEELSIC